MKCGLGHFPAKDELYKSASIDGNSISIHISIKEYFGQIAGGEVIADVPVAYHIIELF